ncbi:MAG: hypothetical protein QM753_07600 [Thermomicrobiales bacterium]
MRHYLCAFICLVVISGCQHTTPLPQNVELVMYSDGLRPSDSVARNGPGTFYVCHGNRGHVVLVSHSSDGTFDLNRVGDKEFTLYFLPDAAAPTTGQDNEVGHRGPREANLDLLRERKCELV